MISKMISDHNFGLECPTKVVSTQLSYILKALFMDTPLAYNLCSSDGQVADGQMARWPGDRWPGSQVIGCRWYEKMINKINRAEKNPKAKNQ